MASIYLQKNVYWIQYYENGKRVQRSLKTKDLKVAKFKKNEIENRLAKGESPLPQLDKPLLQILEEYNVHSQNHKKNKTINDDHTRILSFIEWAGIKYLREIKEPDLRAYLHERISSTDLKQKINLNTANHIITNLKTFINYSIKRNYITINPLKHLQKYKLNTEPPTYLSREEVSDIFKKSANETIFPMIATAIYTGMRLGELKRLTWGDIDFVRDEIVVRLSKAGKFRIVPINKELKNILKPLKKDVGLLCFDYTNARRIFRRICLKTGHFYKEKTGLRKSKTNLTIGWHTFRHTFASHLVMAGVDLVTVSKLLGHSNISTTMIYSHLSQEHLKESIKKINY